MREKLTLVFDNVHNIRIIAYVFHPHVISYLWEILFLKFCFIDITKKYTKIAVLQIRGEFVYKLKSLTPFSVNYLLY